MEAKGFGKVQDADALCRYRHRLGTYLDSPGFHMTLLICLTAIKDQLVGFQNFTLSFGNETWLAVCQLSTLWDKERSVFCWVHRKPSLVKHLLGTWIEKNIYLLIVHSRNFHLLCLALWHIRLSWFLIWECRYLLEKHLVALVPGDAFGDEKGLRISYAASLENLGKALDRLESAFRPDNFTRWL